MNVHNKFDRYVKHSMEKDFRGRENSYVTIRDPYKENQIIATLKNPKVRIEPFKSKSECIDLDSCIEEQK